MFTIGEFSKATGLTVKALRFYHEEGLLVPTTIDPRTGYRYYDQRLIELARTIAYLRKLEFPLNEIKSLLQSKTGDEELVEVMQRQRDQLQQRITQYRKVMRLLDTFIAEERKVSNMSTLEFAVEEKQIPPVMIAGIRMKGRYSECGKAFGQIARAMGRYLAGKPMLLHYDSEFKEEDADFEACIPVRQRKEKPGIAVRELDAVRCVALLHKGPYDQLGRSYAKVLKHVKDRGYQILSPTREIYLKGPGMIFKGNPKNYLTEIQIPIG